MKQKSMSYEKKLRLVGCVMLLPAAVLILFCTVIPFLWNIALSFGEWNGVSAYKFVGLKNYLDIPSTRVAVLAIKNSVIIAVVSTLLAMLIGIAMAMMIYRVSRIEGAIFRFFFYGPAMLPMTVVGLLFTFILSSDMGLLNGVLRAIGLGGLAKSWLATRGLNVVTIGVVQGWKSAGTTMMLVYTAIVAVPSDLFEEARLEGSSYWQECRYIIFPLVKPTIVLTFSMMSMWSFKTYDIVQTMTEGGPGDLSMVAPLYVLNQSFNNGKFGFASAVSIVFAIIIMLIIMAIRKGLKSEAYEY